ncbi:MAG: hypothetical protein WCF68_10155 [Terriglobales bacterium]
MRYSLLAWLLWLGASPLLCGQEITFQQRQDLTFEQRIAKLEAERAALQEDMKAAKDDISKLQDALKAVREQAKSADDRSQTNTEQIGIGRWLVSGIVFILGVIVTQAISQFMANRSSRAIRH